MTSKEKSLANADGHGISCKKEASGDEAWRRDDIMSGRERQMLIRQSVQSLKKVSVAELSRQCRVTEETIRRDLDKLELEGVITRVHGGAIWNEGIHKEGIHFYRRMTKQLKEKQEISRKAMALLEGKHVFVADSSTTVMETLKLMPDNSEIIIVTNSTEVFHEFQHSAFNIISTGGEFNKKSLSLQGMVAKTNIAKYSVQLALMSCKSLSMEKGAQDTNEDEAEIKKIMIEQAEEVALLVDSTKFDQTAFVSLGELDSINYIVTDKKPSDEWIGFCEERGIQLIY